MILGHKVKRAREKKGWNQKQLAEETNLTQATISRIESGEIVESRTATLFSLMMSLGVSAEYLSGDVKEDTSYDILLRSDENAALLLKSYQKLSPQGKEQLTDFVRFLVGWEKKRRVR